MRTSTFAPEAAAALLPFSGGVPEPPELPPEAGLVLAGKLPVLVAVLPVAGDCVPPELAPLTWTSLTGCPS